MFDGLPEGVRSLSLSLQKIQLLWHAFNDINGIFDDFNKNDQKAFLSSLMSPTSVWLEVVDKKEQMCGVLYASNIVLKLSASVHFVFFDGKLRGREPLLLSTIKWLTTKLHLKKVNAFIPSFAKRLARAVRRLGFKQEGIIRNWSYSNQKLYDIYVFGMTEEEIYGTVLSADTDRDASVTAERLGKQPIVPTIDGNASTTSAGTTNTCNESGIV